MIEDMKDEDILDKARMEGMNQGIWLAVQELAHDGRWTQAAEELIYRQAMWLSFAQGLVLTRKDTRGTRMMYLIDR